MWVSVDLCGFCVGWNDEIGADTNANECSVPDRVGSSPRGPEAGLMFLPSTRKGGVAMARAHRSTVSGQPSGSFRSAFPRPEIHVPILAANIVIQRTRARCQRVLHFLPRGLERSHGGPKSVPTRSHTIFAQQNST